MRGPPYSDPSTFEALFWPPHSDPSTVKALFWPTHSNPSTAKALFWPPHSHHVTFEAPFWPLRRKGKICCFIFTRMLGPATAHSSPALRTPPSMKMLTNFPPQVEDFGLFEETIPFTIYVSEPADDAPTSQRSAGIPSFFAFASKSRRWYGGVKFYLL